MNGTAAIGLHGRPGASRLGQCQGVRHYRSEKIRWHRGQGGLDTCANTLANRNSSSLVYERSIGSAAVKETLGRELRLVEAVREMVLRDTS